MSSHATEPGFKPAKLFIGGKSVDCASGRTFDVLNPATGMVLATAERGDAADIDRAVKAARAAYEAGPWRKVKPSERSKMLWRIAELIDKNRDELGRLESLNNGKTLKEAQRGDMRASAEIFYYYSGWARHYHGETLPVDGPFFAYTLREPLGVVGMITPWNYPLMLAAWKVAPALATGNTCVIKPSELTPLTTLRLAELCQEAGVPDGVVNVVTGYGSEAGQALGLHPDVDKIAFTGSIRTARALLKAAGESNLKRLTLELGGKSPNIVFPDADLDTAVPAAFWAIYANKGEICSAGSRLLLHQEIHDTFLDRLVDKAKKMKVGDPLDPSTEMGAQISQAQLDRILGYIESGKQEGARLLCGGERDTEGAKAKGLFIRPTVFDGVGPNMRIAQEEIFGPVLAAMKFQDDAEAVSIANGTIYGLASAVWTKDIRRAHRLAREMKAGVVWVNAYNAFDSGAPFGGFKQSGFGREQGMHALESYTQVKTVWVGV
jgi:aldehyde dehydrogenase (NAD+)